MALGSANRDDYQFANGDTFDIQRENADEHLAFGWAVLTIYGDGLGAYGDARRVRAGPPAADGSRPRPSVDGALTLSRYRAKNRVFGKSK